MSSFAQDFVEALDDTGTDIIIVFIVDMNNLRAQEADLLVVFCYHASWLLHGCMRSFTETGESLQFSRDRLDEEGQHRGQLQGKGGHIPF